MEPWFLRDPTRFYRERQELIALAHRSDWLVGHEWRLTDAGLGVDAVICAHSHDYEVRISFPTLFPDAPAVVRPRNADNRLSQHQYGGADGPLCLQWGPDNWHRDVTAALMLESAYELLHTENPLGRSAGELPIVAPSRHYLTLGQELRTEWARWYSSHAFEEFIRQHDKSAVGSLKFSFRALADQQWVALVHEATPLGGQRWIDESVPSTLPEAKPADLFSGVWFHVDASSTTISNLASVSGLGELVPSGAPGGLLAMDGSSPIEGMQRWLAGAVLRDREQKLHLLLFFSSGELFHCGRLDSLEREAGSRTPDADQLAGKMVGIVGLGSAGSKIAIALARMGVGRFYLVDHDVLLPANLERHALDWQGVGLHKVDAIANSLRWIAPSIEINVSRLHLTGQESNAAVAGALSRLAECDVIVDATASPRVFNLLAAIARTAQRPLVWLEVFGGGIGGMVARSRPTIDATAQDMRLAFLRYCEDNPAPESLRRARRYAVEEGGDAVIEASDADVGIMANHAAKLLVDSLLPAAESKFTFSLYLVGLASGWVFTEPFETIPLLTGAPVVDTSSGEAAQRHETENLALLRDLLTKTDP
jgi:hypothetical protein